MTATAPMELGVLLSTFDTYGTGVGDMAADARRLEHLGFDSIWVGDHLQFNVGMLEAFTVLGAAAAVTSRVALGTAVLLPALRPPAWVAKQVATVQHLSDGRLVLGVGVGGENAEEWVAAGVPRSERGRRTDALLGALPDMLGGRPATLGPPYMHDVPPLEPACQPPLIWVGGRSDAALRRTATYGDTWVGAFAGAKLLGVVKERLAELTTEADRPMPRLATVVFVHIGHDRPAAEDVARRITRRQYNVPFEAMDRYIIRGPLEDVEGELAGYCDIGVEHLIVMAVDLEPRRQYEPLAELRLRLRARAETAIRKRAEAS